MTTLNTAPTVKAPAGAYRMQCACCGSDAGRWKQWFNQDSGYGVCARCVDWIMDRERRTPMGPAEFRRTYGVPGVNYEPKLRSHNGRWFVILAEFPNTEDGTREANDYMAAFPGASVLVVADGRVILADKADMGVTAPAQKKTAMVDPTAGPLTWKAQGEANDYAMLMDGDWLAIIRQNGRLMPAKQEANMRLWAASPKLLGALRELQANPNDPRAHRLALDAIKLATTA